MKLPSVTCFATAHESTQRPCEDCQLSVQEQGTAKRSVSVLQLGLLAGRLLLSHSLALAHSRCVLARADQNHHVCLVIVQQRQGCVTICCRRTCDDSKTWQRCTASSAFAAEKAAQAGRQQAQAGVQQAAQQAAAPAGSASDLGLVPDSTYRRGLVSSIHSSCRQAPAQTERSGCMTCW